MNFQQAIRNMTESEKKSKLNKWLRRIGVAGFVFFLIKGIVWLFLFYWFGKSCT